MEPSAFRPAHRARLGNRAKTTQTKGTYESTLSPWSFFVAFRFVFFALFEVWLLTLFHTNQVETGQIGNVYLVEPSTQNLFRCLLVCPKRVPSNRTALDGGLFGFPYGCGQIGMFWGYDSDFDPQPYKATPPISNPLGVSVCVFLLFYRFSAIQRTPPKSNSNPTSPRCHGPSPR